MRFPFSLFVWVASIFATAAASSAFGNFSRSCTGVGLVRSFILGATCCHPDDDGTYTESTNELDLTMCIGLDQTSGRMRWEVYGKFSNYCTDCTIYTSTGKVEHLITCSCEPLVGGRGPVRSTLNLDEGIANDWGILKCAGGIAASPRGGGD
ncbi:hypothetical protein L209DRAFT_686459 [Thermothelomyces heterothallicus CBS 203.75]